LALSGCICWWREGVVTDLSPFSAHKLPRDIAKTKPTRRAFSNDECLALMAKVYLSNDTVLADLITLGLYTSARIEELCRLKVDDIITEDSHRACHIAKSKTQAGTRTVPLHPAIIVLVDRLAADILGLEKQTITYGLYSGGTSMAQKMEVISKISY